MKKSYNNIAIDEEKLKFLEEKKENIGVKVGRKRHHKFSSQRRSTKGRSNDESYEEEYFPEEGIIKVERPNRRDERSSQRNLQPNNAVLVKE